MKKILFLVSLMGIISFANTGNAIYEDCMSCHEYDVGIPAINISLFGVHRDINDTDGGILSNGDCTVCHYDVSKMMSPGFTVSTYSCEDCHVNGAAKDAPKVYNHIRNANISVNAFCADCHNKSVNLFKYSANASSAHYGRSASFGISGGEEYCTFCHRNSSTIYKDVMQNRNNDQINSHTTGIINPGHPAGRPDCTTCHGQDELHGQKISKPDVSSLFCNNCHTNDRIKKNRHNDKVECTGCHMQERSDIHDIKYVTPDGSYRGIIATACGDCHDSGFEFALPFPPADCTTCHQGNGLPGFALAPKIPVPVNHSTNPYSGALWNGSQPAYWSNTSQKSACNYCHGNTLHDPNAAGKIRNIQSGNMPGQSITSMSYWCANCHYMGSPSGNYSYNASSFYPVPPEIQNKTGLMPQKAADGTNFFNHSLTGWSDDVCRTCHSDGSANSTTRFIHSISTGGGGADCISCHDTNSTGAPGDKKINIMAFEKSVHNNLNDGGNRACWACHGDGREPAGHPAGYRTPRKCSNDNCHSLNQDYRAPMVYSHFRNASLNGNPDNALDFNVTTQEDCENCHANNALIEGKNMYSTASHYASLELPDSKNCIYCHLNEENSQIWGNAIRINRNTTSLVELDRVKNKFTLKAGESMDLGSGFKIKLLEVSKNRNALVELFKNEISVDRSTVGPGNYTYEEVLIIDNSSIKRPVIDLNFTGFFYSGNISFVQFEGYRLKRMHAENKTTSCYLCHFYSTQKIKYRVIERVEKDKDDIYYTEELVNFSYKKEYNETEALRVLASLTGNDAHADIGSVTRKAIFEDGTWNISGNYYLQVRDVTTDSGQVFMKLQAGNYSYENIVRKGDVFAYAPEINLPGYRSRNITIFRARVSEIINSRPGNMVVLEDVVALSPEVKKTEENRAIYGYNSSWLWENSTFTSGKFPLNFHSPQIYGGRDGGGDCLTCHGNDGYSGNGVSLGKHETLNGGGNRACYACHGGSEGIRNHPAGFRSAGECSKCHASATDNYGAIYIGDEEHKNETCKNCHVETIHNIRGYDVLPSVKKIALDRQENRIILKAFATAGYKMRVRDARYYLDLPGEKFPMYPVDGSFDSQIEEVFADINITGISPGKHTIYIESMERDNKWGTPASLEISLEGKDLIVPEEQNLVTGILVGGLALLLVVLGKIFNLTPSH